MQAVQQSDKAKFQLTAENRRKNSKAFRNSETLIPAGLTNIWAHIQIYFSYGFSAIWIMKNRKRKKKHLYFCK